MFTYSVNLMTIKEIAGMSGVSIGTVDRVIYKRGRVSAETKARVERVISKYGLTINSQARLLKRGRPYRFCSLLPKSKQDAGYWEQILDGIKNGEAMVSPLGVNFEHIEYDRYDFLSWNKAVKKLMRSKPDGIIFAPVMPDTTLPSIEKLQSEGVPVIFVDAEVSALTPRCLIAQDAYKSGYFAGKIMHLYINDKDSTPKKVAVIGAHSEDYHLQRRRDGFLAYTAGNGIPVIVYEYSGYKGLELPETEIEQFLCSNNDLCGVFITNVMGHRVSSVVSSLKLSLCVIGYDLIPENQKLLGSGGITAIISQSPEEQGRQAILNLYRCVVLGQTIPPRLEIPINVYIKENIPAAD